MDRYETLEELGQNHYATVFEGHDCTLDRPVAIMQFKETLLADPERKARIWDGVKAMAAAADKNIVPVYDLDESRGWIVMKMLRSRLGQRVARSSTDVSDVASLINQLLKSLRHLHRAEVYHGDIRPSNLLYNEDGQILLSFSPGLFLGGTVPKHIDQKYTAPEILNPEVFGEPGAPTDLYLLGFTALELLAGPEFDSHFKGAEGGAAQMAWMRYHADPSLEIPPAQEIHPELPAALAEIFNRMLQKRVADRYQSADEVLNDISEHVTLKFGEGPAKVPSPNAGPAPVLRKGEAEDKEPAAAAPPPAPSKPAAKTPAEEAAAADPPKTARPARSKDAKAKATKESKKSNKLVQFVQYAVIFAAMVGILMLVIPGGANVEPADSDVERTVKIDSTPSGASLKLFLIGDDGKSERVENIPDKTPAEVELKGGRYRVEVSKDGARSEKTIEIKEDTEERQTVSLAINVPSKRTPETRRLVRFRSDPPGTGTFTLFKQGKTPLTKRDTPADIELEPGKYKVKVELTDGKAESGVELISKPSVVYTYDTELVVPAGAGPFEPPPFARESSKPPVVPPAPMAAVTFTVQPGHASLKLVRVTRNPDTGIRVESPVPLSKDRPSLAIKLKPGSYRIVANADNYQQALRSFAVRPGDADLKYDLRLKKSPPSKIDVAVRCFPPTSTMIINGDPVKLDGKGNATLALPSDLKQITVSASNGKSYTSLKKARIRTADLNASKKSERQLSEANVLAGDKELFVSLYPKLQVVPSDATVKLDGRKLPRDNQTRIVLPVVDPQTRFRLIVSADGKYKVYDNTTTIEELLKREFKIELARNEEYYFRLGQTALAREKYKDALKHFGEAVKIEPKLAEAWNGQGLALLGAEDAKQAIARFTKAVESKGTYAEAYLNRGWARMMLVWGLSISVEDGLAEYQKAEEDFQRAIGNDDNARRQATTALAELYKRVAAKCVTSGKYDRGIAYLDHAVKVAQKIKPSSFLISDIYAARGWLLLHNGQDSKALADFEKALKDSPGLEPALGGRGIVYMKAARRYWGSQMEKEYLVARNKALPDLNKAISISDSHAKLHPHKSKAEKKHKLAMTIMKTLKSISETPTTAKKAEDDIKSIINTLKEGVCKACDVVKKKLPAGAKVSTAEVEKVLRQADRNLSATHARLNGLANTEQGLADADKKTIEALAIDVKKYLQGRTSASRLSTKEKNNTDAILGRLNQRRWRYRTFRGMRYCIDLLPTEAIEEFEQALVIHNKAGKTRDKNTLNTLYHYMGHALMRRAKKRAKKGDSSGEKQDQRRRKQILRLREQLRDRPKT